jgi:hypothetical protein
MNGSSTGFIPSQVSNRKIIKNVQKEKVFIMVFSWNLLGLKIRGNMMIIDISNPITPPNLFGIARKIA